MGHGGVPAGALASSYGGATTGQAGISGRVWLTGVPPPEIPIHLEGDHVRRSARSAAQHSPYVVTHDGGLANVLSISKTVCRIEDFPFQPTSPVVGKTKGCLFATSTDGLAGQAEFRIQNSIRFSQQCMSPPGDQQGIQSGSGRQRARLMKKGLRTSRKSGARKCDVHPWMFAYSGSSPTRFLQSPMRREPSGFPRPA